MIYPSQNAKHIDVGKYYTRTKPMVRSNGPYVLASRLAKPKPMARTVTRRMRIMRAAWFALDDWRANRLRMRAAEMPDESGAWSGLLVVLAVLCIVMAWHIVAR